MTRVPDRDEIPDELLTRDQWLCWSSAAHTPRMPLKHPDDTHGCSWTDPDEWMSFDEAATRAREMESGGVGFVFARSNDDYPRGLYGGLDLDGCVVDGSPADWLPSLQPFFDRDCWMECSPSGEGIHIPLVGLDVPEWFDNPAFDDREHVGVEAYESKFFTVTGDTLEGSGETVGENGEWVIEWLEDVYREITGEDPGSNSENDGGDSRDTTLDRDEIEDIEQTSESDVILDAVDQLQPSDVSLRSTFVEDENSETESWDPGYRQSDSGKSLKRVKSTGVFVDMAESDPSNMTGFGVLDLLAAEAGIINRPWDDLSGDDWWDAVDEARDFGANIPEYKSSLDYEPETSDSMTEAEIQAVLEDAEDESDEAAAVLEDSEDDVTVLDDTEESRSPSGQPWMQVSEFYSDDQSTGRRAAADKLESDYSWMFVLEEDRLYIYDDETGRFSPWGETKLKQILESNLPDHYSIREADQLIDRISTRNQIHRSELNGGENSKLLCVGDGVIDLETGDMMDHSPEYHMIRGLDWDYDAPHDADPIIDFVDDIVTREEDRDTILDHLGHGLIPGHPYRAFVLLHGPGGSGKTQLGRLLRAFVGEDNAAAVELQDLTGDGDSYATGDLPGKMINIGDDISQSEIRDTSIIKSLTGSGTIRSNEKYEKTYDFENEAAMFFSANEPPRFREKSGAIADRLYPIECPFDFVDDPDPENPMEKQKEPGIYRRISDNDEAMRGLLHLAIEHAQRLIEDNGEYSMPEGPQERMENYERAADPIGRFVSDYLEAGTGSDKIVKSDAYAVYSRMTDKLGERTASEDVFKRKVSQTASIPIESGRSRSVTSGDSRDRVWKHVKFDEERVDELPDRIVDRYFDDLDDDEESEEEEEQSEPADPVRKKTKPIERAADSLTGYVSVSVRIEEVIEIGDDGLKAILSDETGAIDLISWDGVHLDKFEELEGKTVKISHAEVDEYDGTRQLKMQGLSRVEEIQEGVGYTDYREDDEDESGETRPVGIDKFDGDGDLMDVLENISKQQGNPFDRDMAVKIASNELGVSQQEIQDRIKAMVGDELMTRSGQKLEVTR